MKMLIKNVTLALIYLILSVQSFANNNSGYGAINGGNTLSSAPSFVNSYGGYGPGNGGDIFLCVESSENNFVGYYTLDYVMTFHRRNNNQNIAPETTAWEKSSKRISKIFKKYFRFASDFDTFLLNQNNYDNPGSSIIWRDISAKLIDVKDEELVRSIPENCRAPYGKVFQAVKRIKQGHQIIYEIDGALIKELSPTQYSFHMIHEFLWNYSTSSRKIRLFNRFLHSNFIENNSINDNLKAINNFKPFSQYLKINFKNLFFKYLSILSNENETIAKEEIYKLFNKDQSISTYKYQDKLSTLKYPHYEAAIKEGFLQTNAQPNIDLGAIRMFIYNGRMSSLSLTEIALLMGKDKLVKSFILDGFYNLDRKSLVFLSYVLEKHEIYNLLLDRGFPSIDQLIEDNKFYNSSLSLFYLRTDNDKLYKLYRNQFHENHKFESLMQIALNYKAKKILSYELAQNKTIFSTINFNIKDVTEINGKFIHSWRKNYFYESSKNIFAYTLLTLNLDMIRFMFNFDSDNIIKKEYSKTHIIGGVKTIWDQCSFSVGLRYCDSSKHPMKNKEMSTRKLLDLMLSGKSSKEKETIKKIKKFLKKRKVI